MEVNGETGLSMKMLYTYGMKNGMIGVPSNSTLITGKVRHYVRNVDVHQVIWSIIAIRALIVGQIHEYSYIRITPFSVTDLGVKKIKLGTLCSSTGLEEIKSENECKAAAEKLDLVWEVSYNGPNEFPACFHAEDGKNKVYFNTSPNPSRSTNLLRKKEAAAICRGPTNKGR